MPVGNDAQHLSIYLPFHRYSWYRNAAIVGIRDGPVFVCWRIE